MAGLSGQTQRRWAMVCIPEPLDPNHARSIDQSSTSCRQGDLLDLPDCARADAGARPARLHARRVAAGPPHLTRLKRQMRLLAAAYREVADDVHEGRPVSPAAEWLLDNFHLVANEARGVWRDLPRKYHRRLPRVHPLIAMA